MLSAALIVFREVLEAALVVSIVLAATRGVPGRGRWVSGGILAGLLGAGLVAAFANVIANAAAGVGQELLNAAILLIAVAMLVWHCVWMGRHGREIAAEVGRLGAQVTAGTRPLHALAVVVGVAVLREGSESVLFLYGIAASGAGSGAGQVPAMAGGGLLGVAGGVALGAAMYFGLLQVAARHLFTVTTALVSLLAAGLASQAAAFLVQADLLPPISGPVWNTAWLLEDSSILGKMLHTLIGYTDRPLGIQLVFYVATLGFIAVATWAASGIKPSSLRHLA